MTLNKKYFKSQLIFDFPSNKPVKISSANLRRKITLAAKSVFSARNQPVLLKHTRDKAKCYTRKSLFSFLPARRRIIPAIKFDQIKLFPTSFKFAKLKDKNKKKFKIDTTLPLRFKPRIKQKLSKDFYFSTFVQGANPGYLSYTPQPALFCRKSPLLSLVSKKADFNIFYFNSPAILLFKLPAYKKTAIKDARDINFETNNNFKCKNLKLNFSDDSFLFFHPGNNKLSLRLKKEAEEHFFESDYLCQFNYKVNSPELKTNLEKHLDFDFRSEIGKNLIIEVNTRLNTLKDNNILFARKDKRKLNLVKKEKNDLEVKSFELNSLNYFPVIARISAIQSIKGKRQELNKIEESSLDFNNIPGKFICRTNASDTIKKVRLALKLKLESYGFSDRKHYYTCLLEQNKFKCLPGIFALPFLNSSFKGIILKEKSVGSYKTDYFKKLFKPARNCIKKVKLKFLTRKHGRYSALKLKKIQLPPVKVATYKTSHNINKLQAQSIKSNNYRYSKFDHHTGLFKDFITLLARPKSFLMSVTRLSFTKIVLPIKKRRLKAPTSNYWHFSTGLHKFKPSGSLKDYYFNHGCLQAPDFSTPSSKREKIRYNPKLQVKSNTKTSRLLLKESFNGFINKTEKILKAKISKMIPPVPISDGLPKQVSSLLKLELNIIKCKTGKKLSQTNIIEPPPWQFIQKPYFCTIRLMPFQFGFPSFCLKKIKLLTLDDTSRLSIADSEDSRLQIDYFNFTPKPRIIRSKYSLKNPKYWLFKNELLRHLLSTQQAYYGIDSTVTGNFHTPSTPEKYPFSKSFNKKTQTLKPRLYNLFFNKIAEKKEKSPDFTTIELQPQIFSDSSTPEIAPVKKAKINRLLLKPIRLECKTIYGKDFKIHINKNKIRALKKTLKLKLKGNFVFRTRDLRNIYKFNPIQTFKNKFPAIRKKINLDLDQYHTRFRQFFFPYYPKLLDKIENQLKFFRIEETTPTQDFDPSEEFRTSNIVEFAPVGVEFKTSYAGSFRHRSFLPGFFKANEAFELKSTPPHFVRFTESKLSKIDYEPGNKFALPCSQLESSIKNVKSKIKTDFSKIAQRKITNFAKKLEVKLPELQPRLDSRIKKPGKFDMSAIHWVILLSNFLRINQSNYEYYLKQETKVDQLCSDIVLNIAANCLYCSKPDIKPVPRKPENKIEPDNTIYETQKAFTRNFCEPEFKKFESSILEFSVAQLPKTSASGLKDRLDLIEHKISRISFKTDLPEISSKIIENEKKKIFKMQDTISKGWQFNKVKTKKSIFTKGCYNHPATPDWYDIEMDNPSFYVDTGNNKNSEKIFS
jgi:hypothetical protein